jgi:hypothetical protein
MTWNNIFCFSVLWLWIAFVSSFDTYLTVHLQNELELSEQNLIARAILEADDWNVSRFIGLKMFLTIFVMGFLSFVYSFNKKYAFTAIYLIAIFQTSLFLYLLHDSKNVFFGFSLE